ncbi:MAG: glycosyltransferase, partial [Thiotrichaceae bacterium]
SLIVKVHPGFPELELVSSISSSLAKKILPPDTDLQTVVEQVDLVVAVNYFGAALVQVLCSGKPVIFLTTDRLMEAIQSIDPNYNIYSLPSTFNTVGTGKELWDVVRRHFTDGQYAQQMRLQSRQFYRENLDDSKYPTIGRVIKEVLSKSQDKIINAETVECSVNGNQAVVKKCKIEQLLPHHDTIPVELLNYKYQPGTDGDGSVPLHELEVICKIVRYKQPQTILEFGTYEGETTLRLGANSQAEIYTFDLPPEGHKDYTKPLVKDPELDVYPVTPGVKFHNAPWAHRIHQIFADTQTYDFSQFYGKFDVVFVDACHHYEFVLHDSINALKMIRPGGVIIWHDYASYAPGVMQALNKISKKFPLLHIEGTSLAVYCSQQDIKAEDVEMTLFGNEEQSLCKQATFQSEESKIKCSVIIPTYNRCGLLKKTIESLVHQDFPAGQYEIIVVDNGSTDSTRQVAESAISAYQGHNIRYIFEPEPGLHCGRHRGAIESRGQILCYLDDDVVVDKLWLQGVIETFTNTDAVLVGGKILPKYETEPPEWINQFIAVKPEGKSLGQLSLIDFGNELKQIDPCFVWGCNYSIRKDVLFECGGFHPDSMPFDLIRYRGNGEIALSASIKEKGYKAYYNPKACVYHYISKERLTVEYFCKRMFCQGISDSFAQIRKDGNIQNPITLKIRDAYNKGMAYHHEQVLSDPELLKWILKNEYFKSENSSIEAQLKQFENCSAEERQSFYDGNRNYYEFKERFIKLGVPVKDIEIDINDFEMWRKMNPAMENRYKQLGDVFIEKLLEHHLTYTLLEIKVGDVFIDVAASGSPW